MLYVGKAKNLRNRLNSYFAGSNGLHPRTESMVASAAAVDWTVVATEVEALQLEYSWIKEYEPRFNVKYTDDKSYPFLAVTVGEDYPRIMVMRGAKRKGVRYFGPYSHAWAIRETVDQLLRVFPARTCSKGVFRRAGDVRPALPARATSASAPRPASDGSSMAEHREIVDGFCSFVAGDTQPHLRHVERAMKVARRKTRTSRRQRGCATTCSRYSAPWNATRSCCPTARTPTCWRSLPTTCRPRSRCSTSEAVGSPASVVSWWIAPST